MSQTRRLAAILAADVAGYSRLMGADEEGTLERLKALRRELLDPKIAEHHGRIVKTTGDGMLVEFGSVVDAVRCAVAVQQAMAERNAVDPPDRRIEFRVGINLGDVIFDGDDLFGDGVNIAARLEGLAEPGGICISDDAFRQVRGKIEAEFADLGEQSLKNIARPLRVYRVVIESPLPNPARPESRVPLRPPGGRGRGPRSGRVRWAAPRTGTSAPLTLPSPPGRRGARVKAASFEPNFAGKPSDRYSSESPAQAVEGSARGARVGAAEPLLPLPDKPSIAVLPFANMSGDPEQEYFADGMVEEIITALSRIRWLFVIARNSSFTYKGRAVDVKEVGRELGVRYVLEGSVRKGGGRVRITAQLIEAETGLHLWADRFDGSLEDVFELQDKVAVSVAGVIEPALEMAEIRRSAARPTTDLTAYDLYLRAVAIFLPITRERIVEALGLLDQAIAIDRHYGPALAWAAGCHLQLVINAWVEDPETSRRKGRDLARQALQVAQNDPRILAVAALVLAQSGEDLGAMIGLVDRALALNPSYAQGWFLSSVLRLWAGQPDLAIEHVETSLRLSPRDRIGQPLAVIGQAHFFKRRFDEAAAKLLLSIQDHPGFPPTYRFLAACYAHMGRLDEARAIVTRLRAITPEVMLNVLPWRRPEDRELLLSGLRLAAGEEP